MSADALFLAFAGSVNAVADGLYLLLLAAAARWILRTSRKRAADIPIAFRRPGLRHTLLAADAVISIASRLTLAVSLAPVALVVVPLAITAGSLYVTGQVIIIRP